MNRPVVNYFELLSNTIDIYSIIESCDFYGNSIKVYKRGKWYEIETPTFIQSFNSSKTAINEFLKIINKKY